MQQSIEDARPIGLARDKRSRLTGRGQLGVPALVALMAILLVAAVLRFAGLDRYPPGWHHDEALMGVMAGTVYRGEQHPVFFREYLGQEPLYIYASAAAMALFHDDLDVLPLRATSAAFGLVTVALTFALARDLFGIRVGLVSAALIGSSFWQVMSSRNGYRSITQPLLEALAMYLLWRAVTTHRLIWYLLAGLAMGATPYTYLGARAFPTVFIGYAAWLFVTRGGPNRAAMARGGAVALAALAAVAPLVTFFLTYPDAFSARMGQVFIFSPGVSGGHPWRLLVENLIKMFQGFTLAGESLWRYSIPGRPMFVGAVALAFYVGVVVILVRVWRRDDASALLAIWIAFMFFPSVLSRDVGAYTLRAMGLVPAVFIVPAVGFAWAWERIDRLRRLGARAAPVLVGLALLVDTGWTTRDYFVVWAPSFGASWEGMADAVGQAVFLRREAQPAIEDIFVGNEYYHHPVLSHLARPVYPAFRWFDGRQDVVFSPDTGRPGLYVLGLSGMPPNVDELLPRSTLVGESYFPRGIDGGAPPPAFLAYRLTANQIRAEVEHITTDPALHPVAGRIADAVAPIGAKIDGPVHPGDDVRTTFIWRVARKLPPSDYQMVVQLLDEKWQVAGSVEGLGLPPEEWRPGDIVWSRFSIAVSRATPLGRYRVQVALYDTHSGQRVPVVDGIPGIQALLVGDVRIATDVVAPVPSTRLDARLGPDVVLVGIEPPKLVDRGKLAVTLDWSADRAISQDYTVFVQVLNSDGKLVAQSDGWPANGQLPTSSWLPGEVVRDDHVLSLNPDLPAGNYRVIAGLYLLSTGQRLPVQSGGDYVDLGAVPLP